MSRSASIKIMPVVSYARAHTEEAIAVLVDVMRDPAAKETSRVAAACAILNRGWGTPPQSIQVVGEAPKSVALGNLTTDELQQLHTLVSKVREADEVVEPQDMPDEKDLKNVTALVPVEKQA